MKKYLDEKVPSATQTSTDDKTLSFCLTHLFSTSFLSRQTSLYPLLITKFLLYPTICSNLRLFYPSIVQPIYCSNFLLFCPSIVLFFNCSTLLLFYPSIVLSFFCSILLLPCLPNVILAYIFLLLHPSNILTLCCSTPLLLN